MKSLAVEPDEKRGAAGEWLSTPANLGKRLSRLGEQVPLQEVAADLDQCVALRDGLDAFSNDENAHVFAEPGHGIDNFAFLRHRVDTAHEGHVELDDFGFEGGEAREARVACTEVIDRNAEPELAERSEPRGWLSSRRA